MKIGFIGAGKMAEAIASGLVNKGGIAPASISASARTRESLTRFQHGVGGAIFLTQDNREVVRRSEVVVLAIKPQVAGEVIPALREVSGGKLFVSVMAGVSAGRLESWLEGGGRVIRAMPNTPSLIGWGMTAIAAGSRSTEGDLTLVRRLLETTGKVVVVEEANMDAVTAVSGSGPAYVYHFIEELIRAGVEQGLSESLARELVVQTVLGAASLVEKTGEAPASLAAKVKSPGGTTLAACEVLEKGQWGEILRAAVAAARKRAGELRM
jgi:pyrroline-5-carboxylate reductase